MVFLIQNLCDVDPEVLSFYLAWLASNTSVIKVSWCLCNHAPSSSADTKTRVEQIHEPLATYR